MKEEKMWRLMASVLVISDVGSVSVSQQSTDWPTELVCTSMIEQMYKVNTNVVELMGHKIEMRINATCVPVLRVPNRFGSLE
jgi:hypothetical protein